ncbi:MAG TPA: riboflavin synthase [Vicinamibacterales bacterium]|jgi:riboflavin synthase|nr:riboflavin synthase [Vicinamibacterales bacterium]
MFTGLIEALGAISDVTRTATGLRLRIDTALAAAVTPGDSLAVNGVCLTAVTADGNSVQADVSPETARVTTLGAVRSGSVVNLERPLRADGRLGGHFVQGHVDAPGRIEEIREEGDSRWITVQYPSQLERYIVRKGSIAVDGVSLTVAGVDAQRFDVQIIPFTWGHTNLSGLKSGDAVNLECDVLAKYVARALGKE